MPRGNRRSIGAMSQGAVNQQKDEQIEALREQLENVRSNPGEAGRSEIPVADIVPLNFKDGNRLIRQPRTYFDAERLESLKISIRDDGLREPILVRPLPGNKYGLIDGERRWRCYIDLEKKSIEARIQAGISDEAALEWAITTISLKESVSPLEQTMAVVNLLQLRLDKPESEVRSLLYALNNLEIGNSNTTVEDALSEIIHRILNSLGLKLGSLVARLPLLDLPDYLRGAVMDGEMSPTNALLISRTPDALHQKLIEEGKVLSKAKLVQYIARLKEEEIHANAENPETVKEENKALPEVVSDRWTAIKRSKFIKAGGDSKVTRKLERVNKLLSEIEEYISIQES